MGVFSGEGGEFVGGHGMRKTNLRKAAPPGGPLGWRRNSTRAGLGWCAALARTPSVASLHDPAGYRKSSALRSAPGRSALLSRLLVTAPASAAGPRFWREA